MEIFCFFIGILYRYTLHGFLPIIISFIFFIIPKYTNILFFILGILLASTHQSQNKPKGIPDAEVVPQVMVQGTIASIPVQGSSKTLFLLALEQYDHHPAQGIIQLAWYNNAPIVHAGQRWELNVKLKKPRNYLNPGSMDYVRLLATHHIIWTGYIHSKGNKSLPKSPSYFNWLELRERLSKQLNLLTSDPKIAGIVEALTLNITTHINQESWDLFRRTGTTHLFGISGEHIALVSGMVYGLVRWLWTRYSWLCLSIPAPYVASVSGLLAALGYAFLAGFAPPVQRALIGCFFYTLCSLGQRRFTAWQVWRYALFGVLCIEPHTVFMQGFYFSFLAVACLLLTQQRWRLMGYKSTAALQLSCLIGLMPLTLYWYDYGSINGFIANLFAIPLVGLFIVPLALFTMAVSSLGIAKILMKALAFLITLLFQGLSLTERLANMNINCSIHSIELAVVLIGALLMLVLLPIKAFQWISILWLVLPFFPPRPIVQSGEAKIDVLDVGQGLAVAIRTQHHVLLYDTGDRFFQGNDLGKMVILPYIKTLGIQKIDTIVVSHPDKDHRGGLNSLKKEIQVDQLLVNDPRFYHQGIKCHDYPPWQWDDVSFHFLPIKRTFRGKNNSSCILQIGTHAGHMLLTGDIEKIAEDYLVKTYGSNLASDILLVPHHGSKTSSSYRFLLEVAPRYAIASLGFDNRFHFPHAKTLANMKKLNIPFYRTDICGMVQINLPRQGTLKSPTCFSGKKLQPV